ncbi:MAG: HAMP domain-containing histidine kinase [Prevotella sp.]|nr:HAMP domain-containing histidine kinase [Alistipes senegalensis]MCM1358289.1 HAMP domain-containing histidine kinase [Prevotella sp.]MCM1472974.1 HAMP domain-containing histidine kinase [Muribaculaceae bacterium]
MKKIPDNSILKKEFTIPFFNMKNLKKIFKNIKNKKKSKIYKRKRKTFKGIFAKNVLMGLFLTIIFAVGLFNVGKEYIFSQTESCSSYLLSHMQQLISRDMNDQLQGSQALLACMQKYSNFNVIVDNTAKYQISSYYTENCHALVRLTDKDGNITHSSRMGLQAFVIFGEDDKEYMICDTENKDFPELQQLEQDYMKMSEKEKRFYGNYIIENYSVYPQIVMKSAYVNREEGLFIPHETELNLIKYYNEHAYPEEILETKSYTIDMPEKDGYELIEFNLSDPNRFEKSEDLAYPRTFMCGFYGTDKKAFDRLNLENPPVRNALGGMYGTATGGRVCYQNVTIYIDGEPHLLTVILQVEPWNSVTKPLYFKLVIIFLIAMIVIALFDAWRRNVRNQADYMFEDYQKNLTDSLAHDLKTPLMAIGGYVENILTGNLTKDETNKYLSSVMDNISYTDSIITRTLELNAINSINIKPAQFDLCWLVNNAVEKYSLLLDEKNISVHTDGTGEISADTATLKTIIENLISNAVNYTTDNGKINISISDKNIIIKNTVDKKIDVKELKKPFTKGDKSRSNNSGSGLGLAIAENASAINGFKLDISCTDTEFIAELKF